MKRCIHQKKWYEGKIRCQCTGSIRWDCPINGCKYFYPTLWSRLFGKRKKEKRKKRDENPFYTIVVFER